MKKCPSIPIKIRPGRKIIFTDGKKFPWLSDSMGYFLVKIERGLIHCGFVNSRHEMTFEFVGKNPEKIIREIARRKICSLERMGYIASELMIARDCLMSGKKYVQR